MSYYSRLLKSTTHYNVAAEKHRAKYMNRVVYNLVREILEERGIEYDELIFRAPYTYLRAHYILSTDDKVYVIGGIGMTMCGRNDVWDPNEGERITRSRAIKEIARQMVSGHFEYCLELIKNTR